MASLEAKGLTLGYDRQPVISGLDLTIPAGRLSAIVGANASGKSTLLRGLGRLLKPNQGSVLLDGASIFALSTKEVARRMGILPQGPVAPQGLTIFELVAQGRYPHQSWLRQWSEQDEEAVARALQATELTNLASRLVESLSGGQRQRAWIAMALAQETEVMLLDEPTTFLDIAHQVELLELLSELNRNEGRTMVMVLHDLNQAARYADHLIAIKEGRVYAEGPPREVITEPVVQAVFGIACLIVPDPVAGTPMCVPVGRPERGWVGVDAGKDRPQG
jgi:iron complex transport system ATP-binding protein